MSSPWVQRLAPRKAARLRLFCFPWAGAGPAIFREWSALLPATIELHAICPPGRERRIDEPALPTIDAVAEATVAALRPYLFQPFALFGHSFGALVAFEVARALRRAGSPAPEHLFVSGRPAPQLAERREPLHRLGDDDFLRAMVARYDGISREILAERELVELVLPTLRADVQAAETYQYRPEPPLPGPITALGASNDSEVPESDLHAWAEHTQGRFDCSIFPGEHFFVNDAQMRATVLSAMAHKLGLA
jgi:surfactin synthase thioesterase subunit